MSESKKTPGKGGPAPLDAVHQRGETGDRLQRTASVAPKDPVAHIIPGAVPGNTAINNTGARMRPRQTAGGETTIAGTTAEGASGGAGLPGGTPPIDDNRKPKRE
jgi:hypothetical protein